MCECVCRVNAFSLFVNCLNWHRRTIDISSFSSSFVNTYIYTSKKTNRLNCKFIIFSRHELRLTTACVVIKKNEQVNKDSVVFVKYNLEISAVHGEVY